MQIGRPQPSGQRMQVSVLCLTALLLATGCRAIDGLPSGGSLRRDAYLVRTGTREQALAAADHASSDLSHLAISHMPVLGPQKAARRSALTEALVPALLARLPANGQEDEYVYGAALYWSVMHLGPAAAVHAVDLGRTLRPRQEQERRDGWHHSYVLRALAGLGPRAEPALDDIEAILQSPDDDVVREAGRTLGAIGPAALDVIHRHLVGDRAVVREAMARGLGAVRPHSAASLQHLAHASEDPDDDVAIAAAGALVELAYENVNLIPIRARIQRLTSHRSPIVRSNAQTILDRSARR